MPSIHSDFVPLALEVYGGTSEKFGKLLEKLSSKAAEFDNIPYPILLNYWKNRISTVLQNMLYIYTSLLFLVDFKNIIMYKITKVAYINNDFYQIDHLFITSFSSLGI